MRGSGRTTRARNTAMPFDDDSAAASIVDAREAAAVLALLARRLQRDQAKRG